MAEVKMLTGAAGCSSSLLLVQLVVRVINQSSAKGVWRVGSRVVKLSVASDVGLLMRQQLGARPEPDRVRYSTKS